MKKRIFSLLLVLVLAVSVLSFTSCQFFSKECDHEWGQWVTMEAATTTKEGRKERTCLKCGQTESQTIAKIDHEHSFGDWVVIKEATESSKGTKERTCSVCGEKESQQFSLSSIEGNDGITSFKTPVADTGDTFANKIEDILGAPTKGTPAYTVSQYSNGSVKVNGTIPVYTAGSHEVAIALTYLGVKSYSDVEITILDEETQKYVDDEDNIFSVKEATATEPDYLLVKEIKNQVYDIKIKWTESASKVEIGKYSLDFTNALLQGSDGFIGASKLTESSDITSDISNSEKPNKLSYEGVFLGQSEFDHTESWSSSYTPVQYNKTFIIEGKVPHYSCADPDDNIGFSGDNYVISLLFKTDSTYIVASKDRKLSVSDTKNAKILSNIDIDKIVEDDDESLLEERVDYFIVYWRVDPKSTNVLTITADINPDSYLKQEYTLRLSEDIEWEAYNDGITSFGNADKTSVSSKYNYIMTAANGESSEVPTNLLDGDITQIGRDVYVEGGKYAYYYKEDNTSSKTPIGWVVPVKMTNLESDDILSVKGDVFIPTEADYTKIGEEAHWSDTEASLYDVLYIFLSSNEKNQNKSITITTDGVNDGSYTYNFHFENITCLGYIDNFAEFDIADGLTLRQYGNKLIVSGTIDFTDKDGLPGTTTNKAGNYIELSVKQMSTTPYFLDYDKNVNEKCAYVTVKDSKDESFNKKYLSKSDDYSNMFTGTNGQSNGRIDPIYIPVTSENDKIKVTVCWGTNLNDKTQSVIYTITFDDITLAKE